MIVIKIFMYNFIPVIALERFHVRSHTYSASFWMKMSFHEANSIYHVQEMTKLYKNLSCFRKDITNKGLVTLDVFCNFA